MKGTYLGLGSNGFGSYRVDDEGGEVVWTPSDSAGSTLLAPGFVDLHLHGAYGIDLMASSTEGIELLCEKLLTDGYEAFLPTTVTAHVDTVFGAVSRFPKHSMIPGFHLEGPFLSPKFPGAQPIPWIQDVPMGVSPWNAIFDDPRLRLITLAPELENAEHLITQLSSRGVIVSLGHTDASDRQAAMAVEAGARHITHTFNAMRSLHHREPGLLAWALTDDAVRCELIYDRKHVAYGAAKLLIHCKPEHGVLAVSDSTMATGMPPGQSLTMWGLRCVTGDEEVRLESNGALAGSAVTLRSVFRNLHQDFGPEIAIRACCINPRLAIGLTGTPKVYVEFDSSGSLLRVHDLL